MKWIVILFLEFFYIMYFEVQILVRWNNHESVVLMNSVTYVENYGKNNECIYMNANLLLQ